MSNLSLLGACGCGSGSPFSWQYKIDTQVFTAAYVFITTRSTINRRLTMSQWISGTLRRVWKHLVRCWMRYLLQSSCPCTFIGCSFSPSLPVSCYKLAHEPRIFGVQHLRDHSGCWRKHHCDGDQRASHTVPPNETTWLMCFIITPISPDHVALSLQW